jgi:hypothetical protein
MFWLVVKSRHWAIHSAHLDASVYLFESIWGCSNGPEMAKDSIKNFLLVCFGPFLSKEWAK